MPPIMIAVSNQKGGVGKTTTTANLAGALGRKGFRVLVVDADPQGHVTIATVGRLPDDAPTLGKFLLAQILAQLQGSKAKPVLTFDQTIITTSSPNVWLVPGSKDSLDADASLYQLKVGREVCLRKALKSLPPDAFDFVLLDTSPFVGQLTINALVAAQRVLIPVSPEFLSLTGLNDLTGYLDVLREAEIPISVLGYVVTFLDKRIASHDEAYKMLINQLGPLVFGATIRTNSNFKVIPAHATDIFHYEAQQRKPWKGIEDYTALADEVLSRLEVPLPQSPSPIITAKERAI